MKKHVKKWSLFTLRWGIAVIGIWFVLQNISLHDRVLILSPANGRPVPVQVVATPSAGEYTILDPTVTPGQVTQRTVTSEELVVRPGMPADKTTIKNADGSESAVEILGLKVVPAEANRNNWPVIVAPPRNLIEKFLGRPSAGATETIPADRLEGDHRVTVEYPLIDIGLLRIISEANGWYLLLSVLVFPTTFAIISYRWALLVRLLGITISNGRTFVLTMVGLFYNNFMPGSTGGDLIKAYYASKNTPKRTQVILSVLVDRIIGLLALIILGGTMASLHPDIPQCKKIAIISGLIIFMVAAGLIVFYTPFLRRITGLNFILKRLPMQKQVSSAVEAMELYGKHPALMAWSLIVSFPVHATVILSAMFAGKAFGLPLPLSYYWVAVPVIVLSGAVPISPQGAGVMEFFAILLTRRQGCTVTHAFLLTMSIRLVQMLWNLSGAIFVFRGGYAAPHDPVEAVETAATT